MGFWMVIEGFLEDFCRFWWVLEGLRGSLEGLQGFLKGCGGFLEGV